MAKILVIEDDAEVRELLNALLSRAGHTVREARDGREGIHSFRTSPSDLIITDLIMPHKEGLETIIDLRQEFPDLKIIAISGGSLGNRDNYLKTAKLCGASRIFHKPFDNNELLAAVHDLLNGS
ncbi:MAG: response regulator [Gemmatimonadales bacterium]|nr:response regulator [Gemmatimonadales bacterium]